MNFKVFFKINAHYSNPILVYLFQFVTLGDVNAINLVERYDWYFVPIVNPDGYAYTWTTVCSIQLNERNYMKISTACCNTQVIHSFIHSFVHSFIQQHKIT